MKFVTPLRVEWVDGQTWKLLEPLVYESDLLGQLTAPVGMLTDFASVPRLLPVAYAVAGGRGDRAATIHDFLYQTHPCTRPQADLVLREALPLDGVSVVLADLMYRAVREFGASHWSGPMDAEDLVQRQYETSLCWCARNATAGPIVQASPLCEWCGGRLSC